MVTDDPESFADLDGHTFTQTYQLANPAASSAWDPVGADTMSDMSGLTLEEFSALAGLEAAQAVQQQTAQQRIAQAATQKVGSPDYLVASAKGKYGPGDKCNELVADSIEASGLPRPQVPYTGWKGWLASLFGKTRDPDAHEWADPNVHIPGWSSPKGLSEAKAGDVIAQGHGPKWGHSGIVIGPGQTISVDTTTAGHLAGWVTKSNWGFRASPLNGEEPGDRSPVVRHYVGGT
jgi:hypothetical protein